MVKVLLLMSHDLAPPIWSRRASRTVPPVTEEAIVEAAVGLLDDKGFDAVTMRAVAQRIGVTTPSVYWHVENKDGLLNRLYDRLCSETPEPPPGAWQDRLHALANSIRSVFARHRDAARIAVGRFPLGPNGLRVTEMVLAALAETGLVEDEIAYATYFFFSYVTTFSYQETILPTVTPSKNRTDALRRIERYLSALSPEQYPHLIRNAGALSRSGLDSRFAFGLDQFLLGLAVTSADRRGDITALKTGSIAKSRKSLNVPEGGRTGNQSERMQRGNERRLWSPLRP